MYKLISLDMDGTLLNSDKVITEKTREALIRAQKKGVKVVLASGRPTAGLMKYAKELQMDRYHGMFISYNGGKAVDVTSGEVLFELAIPNQKAVELLRSLEPYDVVPFVDDGVRMYVTDPQGFQVQKECNGNNLEIFVVDCVADEVERRGFNPVKILIAAPAEYLDPRISKFQEGFTDDLSFIKSSPYYLEATMKGIHKAETLDHVAKCMGISREEVMSFGDAENDKTMLQYAGMGIAMGNARDELKAIADDVTLSNDEDGIAASIEKYIG